MQEQNSNNSADVEFGEHSGRNEEDQQDNGIGSETESEIFRMIDSNEDLLTSLCPNPEQGIADLSSTATADHSANGESCCCQPVSLINEGKNCLLSLNRIPFRHSVNHHHDVPTAAPFATHEYTSLSVPSAAAASAQTSATNSNNGQSTGCTDQACGVTDVLMSDQSGGGDRQQGKLSVNEGSNILFTSASEANICTCPPGTCQKGMSGCCNNCPGAQDVCEPSPSSPDIKHEDTVVDQVVPMHPGHIYLLPTSMCCSGPTYSNQFTVSRPIANH